MSNISPLPDSKDAHRYTTMGRSIERHWLHRYWKTVLAFLVLSIIGIAVDLVNSRHPCDPCRTIQSYPGIKI